MTRHKTGGDILLHKDRLFFSVVFHPLDIDLVPECSYFGPFLDWHVVDDEPSKQLPVMAFFCSSFFKHVDAGIWLIALLSTCNWGFIDSWSHYVPLGVHGSGLTPSLPGSNIDVESIAFRRFQYFKSHAVCQSWQGRCALLAWHLSTPCEKGRVRVRQRLQILFLVFPWWCDPWVNKVLCASPPHPTTTTTNIASWLCIQLSVNVCFSPFFHAMICPNGVDSIGQYFWSMCLSSV